MRAIGTCTHVQSLAGSTFQTSYRYDCHPFLQARPMRSSIPLPSCAHTLTQTHTRPSRLLRATTRTFSHLVQADSELHVGYFVCSVVPHAE
jgi:hypothetical protein